ncbi:MAG: hypothetical protein PHI44_00635 [Candidatus Ratteibacteria bacterium]|nr:hypothetical protein [Candidatus Ratteibacteria bacterium]
MFKKRFNDVSLFSYVRKDNFDILSHAGRWGYVSLGRTLEKAYYTLFDSESDFPGEAFIRGWKYIPKEGKTLFLGRFMAQSEGIIIEQDVCLSENEMRELLNVLSENGKKFSFFIKDNVPILIFQQDLPREEVLLPDNMKGKNFKQYLYRNQELESIKNLILSSTYILENHPVNRVRQDLCEIAGNILWLWGMGKQREAPDIAGRLGKDIFCLSLEGKALPLPEFFGFKRIDDITEATDNALIWINSTVNKKDNYSIWLRKFEKLDSQILSEVVKEYRKEQCRVLFIFDGFISPDIEVKNCWVPFFYLPEKTGGIHLRKKYKSGKHLLKTLLE